MGIRDNAKESWLKEPRFLSAELTYVPILMNPRAGSRGRQNRIRELMDLLVQSSLEPELFTDRDHLIDRLRDPEARERCRCVVAAGGDGTVGWLINQDMQLPLAIFPVGSENLLARHFGIQRRAPFATAMILHGKYRGLDVGDVNGHRFAIMASAGLDAQVVERVHRFREGHVSRWNYVQATLSCLCRRQGEPISVWLDDEIEPLTVRQVFAFSIPAYALGLPICPQGYPDDGMLDLVAFQRGGVVNLCRYLWHIYRGSDSEHSEVVSRRIRRARLECATPMPLQADGDPAGQLPVEIRVLQGVFDLVVPESVEIRLPHRSA